MRSMARRFAPGRASSPAWAGLMIVSLVALLAGAGCRDGKETEAGSRRPPAAEASGAEWAAQDAAGNRPPRARLEVTPTKGWAGLTSFVFDAGLSSYDRDLTGQLAKRWDFDGDGAWDLRFTRRGRVAHVFDQPGTYRPRLLVRDLNEATDEIQGRAIQVLPGCPPPDFALPGK